MIIKNVPQTTQPAVAARVEIDGKAYPFATLQQVLQQAASALPGTSYSVTVDPVQADPAPVASGK